MIVQNKGVYILPGTILYRYARRVDYLTNPSECPDSGKRGLYFATNPLLSIAMVVEQKPDVSVLGIFVTQKLIRCDQGKYSFRKLHPERYYDKKGSLKKNISPLQEENTNHFDSLEMILDEEYDVLTRSTDIYDFGLHGEVFLSEYENNISNLKNIAVYDLKHYDKVLEIFRNNNYFINVEPEFNMIHDFVIEPEVCTERNCFRRRSETIVELETKPLKERKFSASFAYRIRDSSY